MASEKNLNLKKDIVKEINEKIEQSDAVVLFTYQGLSVGELSELRRELRKSNSLVSR